MRMKADMTRSPSLTGAVLSVLSLPVHLFLTEAASLQFAAVLMGLVAGIYAGFALNDGRRAIVWTEALAALFFIGLALAGLGLSRWFIPSAFVLHAAWDALHHRVISTGLPTWYPPLCAVFDLLFAAGLVSIWLFWA